MFRWDGKQPCLLFQRVTFFIIFCSFAVSKSQDVKVPGILRNKRSNGRIIGKNHGPITKNGIKFNNDDIEKIDDLECLCEYFSSSSIISSSSSVSSSSSRSLFSSSSTSSTSSKEFSSSSS